MKMFFESLSNHCPLIWIFSSRSLNNNINTLHDRALQIAYNNLNFIFNALLVKDSSVTVH